MLERSYCLRPEVGAWYFVGEFLSGNSLGAVDEEFIRQCLPPRKPTVVFNVSARELLLVWCDIAEDTGWPVNSVLKG